MPMESISSPSVPFCPRCRRALASDCTRCPDCHLGFSPLGGVLDVIGELPRETRAQNVEEFYTRSPFPGYAPGDDGATLLDRGRRTPFLDQLDASIAPDAWVLDCGCGTAQLASFLALAGPHRRIIGIDGCRESLTHADEFRQRAEISNLQLVRADLFELPAEAQGFPVVISRGVVHHTPDPDLAIRQVAERVAPGGILVLGFYETMGRAFHCVRRRLGKLVGREISFLDPVLRRRDLDAEKKRIWIDDQYRHPLEHILPLPHVLSVLNSLGFQWVRTVPPLALGTDLFEATPPLGTSALCARRWGWAWQGINDPDAGLVIVIARKNAGPS